MKHSGSSKVQVEDGKGEPKHLARRRHVQTSSIGLPYARAGVDKGLGYYVVCPVCLIKFYGSGPGDAAKDAGRQYAEHFLRMQKMERGKR